MGKVLADNTWVGGMRFLAKGTRREDVDPALVNLVGQHLWADEVVGSNIGADGEALSGLRDNVFVGGVLYEKGSTPTDPAVVAQIGDHMWVNEAPAASADSDQGPSLPGGGPAGSDAGPDASPGTGDGQVAAEVSVPPRGGPGSGKAAWASYAEARGVEVPDGATRDDIIDALDAAGVPTE